MSNKSFYALLQTLKFQAPSILNLMSKIAFCQMIHIFNQLFNRLRQAG